VTISTNVDAVVHRMTPCHEPNCRQGLCLYVGCTQKTTCDGGACKFVQCVEPECRGGACEFDMCDHPTCTGGACVFASLKTSLHDHSCTGGACKMGYDDSPVETQMGESLAY